MKPNEVQTELLRLSNGSRVIRLSRRDLGVCLEATLKSNEPVKAQQSRMRLVMQDMLARHFVDAA